MILRILFLSIFCFFSINEANAALVEQSSIPAEGTQYARIYFLGSGKNTYPAPLVDGTPDKQLCSNDYKYLCTAPKVCANNDLCDGKCKTPCVCDPAFNKTCPAPTQMGTGPTCDKKYKECICAPTYNKECTGKYDGVGDACTLNVSKPKYQSCKCKDRYKYTSSNCNGDNKPSGDFCDGKYENCTCNTALFPYLCNGEGEVGIGPKCENKFKQCCNDKCPAGYDKTNPGGNTNQVKTECGSTCYKLCDATCDPGYSKDKPAGTYLEMPTQCTNITCYKPCNDDCAAGYDKEQPSGPFVTTQTECLNTCYRPCSDACSGFTHVPSAAECPYGYDSGLTGCGGACYTCKTCDDSCSGYTTPPSAADCPNGYDTNVNGCGNYCYTCKSCDDTCSSGMTTPPAGWQCPHGYRNNPTGCGNACYFCDDCQDSCDQGGSVDNPGGDVWTYSSSCGNTCYVSCDNSCNNGGSLTPPSGGYTTYQNDCHNNCYVDCTPTCTDVTSCGPGEQMAYDLDNGCGGKCSYCKTCTGTPVTCGSNTGGCGTENNCGECISCKPWGTIEGYYLNNYSCVLDSDCGGYRYAESVDFYCNQTLRAGRRDVQICVIPGFSLDSYIANAGTCFPTSEACQEQMVIDIAGRPKRTTSEGNPCNKDITCTDLYDQLATP